MTLRIFLPLRALGRLSASTIVAHVGRVMLTDELAVRMGRKLSLDALYKAVFDLEPARNVRSRRLKSD